MLIRGGIITDWDHRTCEIGSTAIGANCGPFKAVTTKATATTSGTTTRYNKLSAAAAATVAVILSAALVLVCTGVAGGTARIAASFLRLSPLVAAGEAEIDPQKGRKLQTTAKETSNNAAAPGSHGGRRPLRVLALGGSNTWGAKLSPKQRGRSAYPHALARFHLPPGSTVDNLAMRATGADYPSLCVESMIAENASDPDASYDLIILEFMLNGTKGLAQLLDRLRRRYPDATIIFLELWSLRNDARHVRTNSVPAGTDVPLSELRWVNSTEPHHRPYDEEDMVRARGGYVFKLPNPFDTPGDAYDAGWFADDWNHLTPTGHAELSKALYDHLHLRGKITRELYSDDKRLGSWGLGDQCYNWFHSGDVSTLTSFSDHKLSNIIWRMGADDDAGGKKHVLETQSSSEVGGGTIAFTSRFDVDVPVGLAYMSMQEPAIYPPVLIDLNHEHVTPIDPNLNQMKLRKRAHITTFAQVGLARPGDNVLYVDTFFQESEARFRIVGVYLCGACATVGHLGEASMYFS